MGLLDQVLGGGKQGGMSPITMGLLGLLAYRTFKGKGRLADMLGRSAPDSPGSTGGLGGLLGSLAGGTAAGGLLSGGLGDLLKQFQDNGQGDKAQSWVSSGPNKELSPQDLEQALGSERLEWLMDQTKLSKEELLEGLSKQLPEVVNKLTPDGHLPTVKEAERLV